MAQSSASELLGRYRKNLLAQGIDGDLLDRVVLDAAEKLHSGELVLSEVEEAAHA